MKMMISRGVVAGAALTQSRARCRTASMIVADMQEVVGGGDEDDVPSLHLGLPQG